MSKEKLEKLTKEELEERYEKVYDQKRSIQASLKQLDQLRDRVKPEVYNVMIEGYQSIMSQLIKEESNYLDTLADLDAVDRLI